MTKTFKTVKKRPKIQNIPKMCPNILKYVKNSKLSEGAQEKEQEERHM